MIGVELARRLQAAGLDWTPVSGDRFVIADRDMDAEVFVVSQLTIEVHEAPTGRLIRFNGTTEWALDSLEQSDALWVPAEHQLRHLLGATFVRLERSDDSYTVVAVVDGSEGLARAATAEEAYGQALLDLLQSLA